LIGQNLEGFEVVSIHLNLKRFNPRHPLLCSRAHGSATPPPQLGTAPARAACPRPSAMGRWWPPNAVLGPPSLLVSLFHADSTPDPLPSPFPTTHPFLFPPSLPPLQAHHDHPVAPSSLSLASCPRRLIGLPLSRCLHATVPFSPLPSVSFTVPRCPSLLDCASPPLSPPLAVELIDALPIHRSSIAALECHRTGPFSPPHQRRPSPVRTPLPHLAWSRMIDHHLHQSWSQRCFLKTCP
jgi:hypothetical protein